ncbi:MAG: hypothetical protein GXO39_05005 [Thermotogae bacterium]|nr:hypothetical protein [Thermotogota bacterium]
MKVLNLSGKVNVSDYPRVFTVTSFPDIVVVDASLPRENLLEISQNFPTIMLGDTDVPTVDYTYETADEVSDFLRKLSSMETRQRLSYLYDHIFSVEYPETVHYVFYYGYSRYLYNTLSRLTISSLKPWVGLYGPNGAGKTSLLKAVLGNGYNDVFHVAGSSMGFRIEKDRITTVVVETGGISEEDIPILMSEIHRKGYQAIFLVERNTPPEVLRTVPFFYVPGLSERPPKERLLLLEHLLRKLEKGRDCRIKVEEIFLDVFYAYSWPNNLAELGNVLRFTLSLSECELKVAFLPQHVKAAVGANGRLPGWERFSWTE